MKHAKKLIALTLALICLTLSMSSCATLTIGTLLFSKLNSTEDEIEFYHLVSKSKGDLDNTCEDLYDYWGDFIYDDKYDSADDAIAAAMKKNEREVETLLENDEEIKKLYREVRDGKYADEVEAVMEAYSDYYTFLMSESWTYNEFPDRQGDLSNALASALRKLEMEL